MKTVYNLLKKKGSQIWAIGPDASIYEAVSMMAEKGIGALLVMEGEQLHGIISERDYARKVILAGKSSRQTPVREIMTTAVLCAFSIPWKRPSSGWSGANPGAGPSCANPFTPTSPPRWPTT